MPKPEIAHADVDINERGRVVIQMHKGYSFYDKAAYNGLTDEEGNARAPFSDEIAYSRYGVFSPDTDFNARFVVVKDSEINNTLHITTEAEKAAAFDILMGVSE